MYKRINNAVGLIGCGRFGAMLAKILCRKYDVKVFDIAPDPDLDTIEWASLTDVLKLKTIFIAVPIRNFSKVIKNIAPKLGKKTTIIDTCSVKLYPVEVMRTHLPKHVGIIATHPLFGPDSTDELNYEARTPKIIMHATRDNHDCYYQWKSFFSHNNMNVIEMTPDRHDRFAAESQGLTHFIGRVLEYLDAKDLPISTLGYEKLLDIMDQTCHDTWDLFIDLQHYNPYSDDTLQHFIACCQKIQEMIAEG